MSVLEAMSQGRPIVATGVGGVPDVVKGCGALAAPGDDHSLAMGVVMLLRNPDLAWRLGQRGHDRLGRIFNEDACVEGYRALLHALTRERALAARGGRHEPGRRCGRGAWSRRGSGRAPQDALEAAVVLEAWAGVPAQQALETARALMPRRPAAPLRPAARRRRRRRGRRGSCSKGSRSSSRWRRSRCGPRRWRPRSASRSCATRSAGAAADARPAVGAGWRVISAGPRGSPGWRAQRGALALAAVAARARRRRALLGRPGALAALLIVTWTGGHRPDPPRLGGGVLRASVAARGAGDARSALPAPALVAARRGGHGGAGVVGAGHGARPAPRRPGRWSRTLGAGLTGAGLGVLLVARPDGRLGRRRGAGARAAALRAGALWAGRHLWSSPEPSRARSPGSRRAPRADAAPPPRARGPAAACSPARVAWRLTAADRRRARPRSLRAGRGRGGPRACWSGFGLIALATLLVGAARLARAAVARRGSGVAAGVARRAACARRSTPPFAGAGAGSPAARSRCGARCPRRSSCSPGRRARWPRRCGSREPRRLHRLGRRGRDPARRRAVQPRRRAAHAVSRQPRARRT